MKRLAPYALMLLVLLTTVTGFSQNPNTVKPKQFENYPSIINCQESELSRIFSTAEGQDITVNFSNNLLFPGKLTSNMVKYSNLQSALIKSAQFNNSIFEISKITNPDNSITYTGIIINMNYFDGYELKRDVTGNYKLIKMETDKVIQSCTN